MNPQSFKSAAIENSKVRAKKNRFELDRKHAASSLRPVCNVNLKEKN